MLHIIRTSKPLEQVMKDLEATMARHKFGVLGAYDLKAKMAEKGVSFDPTLMRIMDEAAR